MLVLNNSFFAVYVLGLIVRLNGVFTVFLLNIICPKG